MTTNLTHPKLVPYARYRWDKIRNQHQLVYPEGVIELNEPGAQILKHCDGRPIEDLIATLSNIFNGADVQQDVEEFVDELARKGLIKNQASVTSTSTDLRSESPPLKGDLGGC